MDAVGIERALSSLRQTYLQDEPSREAKDALEAFVRFLLTEHPSLRGMIVKLVEDQAWNEASFETSRPTDQPNAPATVEARECDRRDKARARSSNTSGDAATITHLSRMKKKSAMPVRTAGGTDASIAVAGSGTRNVTAKPSMRADEQRPAATRDARLVPRVAARGARVSMGDPESEPESSSATDGSVTTEGDDTPSTGSSDSESDLEPAVPGDATIVTHLAPKGPRSFMRTPESGPELSPHGAGRRVTHRVPRAPMETADLESEPPARDTTREVRNAKKRPCSDDLSPQEKRARFDTAGAEMSLAYANLHYLCFVFSRALKARRGKNSIGIPSDEATFQERFNAISVLAAQRELRKLQSIYLATGLAREWAEASKEWAAAAEKGAAAAEKDAEDVPRRSKRKQPTSKNRRKNLVPRNEAYKLVGELSDHDLNIYRRRVNRWLIYERTRLIFEQELGEQSIIAAFAFPNSTCDISKDLEKAFHSHLKERIKVIADRFRPISLSLLDFLWGRRSNYPEIKLEYENFEYYINSDNFPSLSFEKYKTYFTCVDPKETP